MIKTSKFDVANYLKSPQAMADYLSEALATDDPEFICDALDTIARAKGMTQVAKENWSFPGKSLQIAERYDKAGIRYDQKSNQFFRT
jgi:hypothetical protein